MKKVRYFDLIFDTKYMTLPSLDYTRGSNGVTYDITCTYGLSRPAKSPGGRGVKNFTFSPVQLCNFDLFLSHNLIFYNTYN